MVKFTGTESRLRSPGAGAAENGELLLNVYRIATGVMKTFWKQRAVTAAVSAILQGYGAGRQPVTDASAELHRLCGCLELLLQVGPPLAVSPSSPGPDNQ